MCPEVDLPDFTRKMVIEHTGGFVGLEELATRLGFIAPFDLRGNVVLMEDFETEETEWEFFEETANDLVERVSRRKWSGNWSIHFHTDTVLNAYTSAVRRIYYSGKSKYGLFARAALSMRTDEVQLWVLFHNGERSYKVGVKYSRPLTTLTILDFNGADTIIDDDLLIFQPDPEWLPILLIFDLVTQKFDKLYFGGIEYDISGLDIVDGPSPGFPYTLLGFEASRIAGWAAFDTYWDDIILVRNVP